MMPNKPQPYRPTRHARAKRQAEQRRRAEHDTRMYRTKWWEQTRLRIASRDAWTCQACGKDVGLGKGDYHCDHKRERPAGAPVDTETHDADENLQTLCVRCHNAKTGRYVQGRGGTPQGAEGLT